MAATADVYNRLHNSSLGGGSGVGVSGGGVVGMGHHSQLARSLERILEEAHLSGELILTNRKLKDFPKTATKYNLADTVIADLSRNRFCELPEEVTTFSFLETLLLYHNTIRCIPESVKHLTSLTYLDLRSNQLSTLPREICFLPLQVLLVSNNRLAALPDELGRMDRLTDLDASYNQLTALPARIGELRSLRSFSLRSNQLMYLPRELTCLTLVSLDVSNNRIASLPLEIRQMSTLVEFSLEHNPLTSPPASLCIRGLVHVFKFLETQAAKDEKGSRAGGNYDGYTTLRRTPRHNSSGNVLESNRVPRPHVDSGYSTSDGIDKRWSHDMPSGKGTKVESPLRRTPTTLDSSLHSSSSTIVDETISASVSTLTNNSEASPTKQRVEEDQPAPPAAPTTLHQHINYAQSSSSSGSSPEQEDLIIDGTPQGSLNGKADEKLNKNLGNIQTYREYKEALKQQRNQEISSVYKIKGQKTISDMSDTSNALNANHTSVSGEETEVRLNGATPQLKSIMKGGGGGGSHGINGADDCVILPKKPIQKVIPSRNTEVGAPRHPGNDSEWTPTHTNGGDCLGYVKPSSPMKTANGGSAATGGILTNNNNKLNTIKSPVIGTAKLGTAKTHRTVTWNHDIPPEKLSFTMRREFDRQREETELMTQLRSIIETRLKMTLPEDIASALTDGVILCHLANYVRPRSVASIHVPSPGVSKLTMARCRRNVDNFLEACRKIGVDEELICSCADVVPTSEDECNNLNNNNGIPQQHQQQPQQQQEQQHDPHERRAGTLPKPSAVLKTVSALIAMDSNPHHQNIRNLQQQHELQFKLQQHEERLRQHQMATPDTNGQSPEQPNRNEYRSVQRQDEQSHQQQQQHEQRGQQQRQEQDKLTATCTKKQMSPQNAIVAPMEFDNSTFCFTDSGQFESVAITSNGHCRSGHDLDRNSVHVDTALVLPSKAAPPNGGGGGGGVNSVRNFLRHAKLKTFQKMKLNLISSSLGHGVGAANCNNNHCPLQTIVETDSDPGSAPPTAGGGAYELINERPPRMDELPADNDGCQQYQMLPVATEPAPAQPALAIVSKRIEFFEHSSLATKPPAGVSAGVGVGVGVGGSLVSTSLPRIGLNGGGTSGAAIAIVKPKMKANIFSIYRVADVDAEERLFEDCKKEKEAGSSTLLKHDSGTLTIILSCVFIVSFLLLIFFPLPG